MTTITATVTDISEATRQAIDQFLQEADVVDRFPSRSPSLFVQNEVREIVYSWNLGVPKERIEKTLLAACHIGCSAYQHTSQNFQVAMSVFTTSVIILDDGIIDAQALREFGARLYTREAQIDHVLDRVVEATRDICALLPIYGANRIYANVLTFANEELWLNEDGKDLVFHPNSRNYIEYSRLAEGLPEPYTFGIWPKSICPDTKEYIQAVPDAITVINNLNDLFSSYKELLDQEEHNYVHQYARAYKKPIREAIDDLVRSLISSVRKVRNILGEGKARDAWESFLSGYTSYHLYCPRYKLNEVIPEYF